MSNVTYRKNEDLKVIKEGWRGNRVEKGRFINLEAHVKHGVGSVLKWRLSRNPQWKEKKEERWDPEIVPLESIDSIYRNADSICAVSKTYVNRALSLNQKCKSGATVFLGTNLDIINAMI